jgi:SAM-dependent methyltransferase
MNVFRKLIQIPLRRLGYQLTPVYSGQIIPTNIPDPGLYTGPEDFLRLYRPWLGEEFGRLLLPEITANTGLSRQKLYWLLNLCRQTMCLDGDIFEAGTGSGGFARLVLNCLPLHKSRKTLWLLDTFEGYQKIDLRKDGAHVQLNQCRGRSYDEVRDLLAGDAADVNLIKGLIPATLAEVKTNRICFAHIDVNLYEPTLAATEFCLRRLAPGGIMIFDDYCWPATYSARKAIDDACARTGHSVICVPESTQAFLIQPASKPHAL